MKRFRTVFRFSEVYIAKGSKGAWTRAYVTDLETGEAVGVGSWSECRQSAKYLNRHSVETEEQPEVSFELALLRLVQIELKKEVPSDENRQELERVKHLLSLAGEQGEGHIVDLGMITDVLESGFRHAS